MLFYCMLNFILLLLYSRVRGDTKGVQCKNNSTYEQIIVSNIKGWSDVKPALVHEMDELPCVINAAIWTRHSLFMDLVAGNEFQISHICPGQLPALLGQVFKRGVSAGRGCRTKMINNKSTKMDTCLHCVIAAFPNTLRNTLWTQRLIIQCA